MPHLHRKPTLRPTQYERLRELVPAILQREHGGTKRAIVRERLLEWLRQHEGLQRLDDRKLRDAVARMVEEEHIPIATLSSDGGETAGYCYVETWEDARAGAAYLRKTGARFFARADALEQAAARELRTCQGRLL